MAWLRRHILEAVLVLLCGLLARWAPNFLTRDNLLNVLRNVSMQGIIAFGMTLVIISGEIDLSVGSAAALAGCVCAWVVEHARGGQGASVGAVLLGALAATVLLAGCGALAGLLRVRSRVPTFITTLAWLTIFRGAAMLLTHGFPLTPFPEWYSYYGSGYWHGVPVPTLVFAATFAALWCLAHRTTFGRAVYAVGGNAEAARLSGISITRTKLGVMVLVGTLSALSGLLLSSQIQSGNATAAPGWELEVISAVIIGGTSLMGGSGTMAGTLLGVIFLGVLGNGMTLLNIKDDWQNVVRGALILGAVLLNSSPGREE